MKRYCYFALAALFALTLSACKKTSSRTVVYTDPIPYLTTATMGQETLPPDTYSEYAATMTHTSEASIPVIGGVPADTAVTAPQLPEADTVVPVAADTVLSETAMQFTDTAAAPDNDTSTDTNLSDISAQGFSLSEESTETSAPVSRETAISITVPSADTAVSGKISADTVPEFSSETLSDTNTSNGGTENAN